MIGFCILGYYFSKHHYDIRYGFYYSFFMLGLGALLFTFAFSPLLITTAILLYGIGIGLFWLTIHTYELTETRDDERDFYSSLLSAGGKVLLVVCPIVATALLYLSKTILHLDPFIILFSVIPFIFLLGLFSFSGIQTYKPSTIELADLRHFFIEKRNAIAQLYMAGNGMGHFLGPLIIPLAALTILGNEMRVGIFNAAIAILSSVLILILGKYRDKGNRFIFLCVATILGSVFLYLLGYYMSSTILVIYAIASLFLDPIKDVSNHVISLQTMESIGRRGKDFYATMILRDFSLWVWRMVIGVLLLYTSTLIADPSLMIKIGIFAIIAVEYITVLGAYILLKTLNKLD
jgi:MFS family permease